MDIPDSLFNSLKNTLVNIFNSISEDRCTLSTLYKEKERYANISEISKCGNGIHLKFRLLNDNRDINVDIRKVCLLDDGHVVSLYGFKSDSAWLQHILEDFVEGKKFLLPDSKHVKRRDFSIQAILSEMLHTPDVCFNREQFLRAEFKRFYPQDIIDKIVISNPANVGVPPEVIEEILKPLFVCPTFTGCLSGFKYGFNLYNGFEYIYKIDDISGCLLSIVPRWQRDEMLDFCRGSLVILQIFIYIYGLQQIDINNNDTSNFEIINFFIISMLVMLELENLECVNAYEKDEVKNIFLSILNTLRKRDTCQQIIKEVMADEISHDSSRKMAKWLEQRLINMFTSYSTINMLDFGTFHRKIINDCLKLELYYPQYIQTLRENRSLI